MKRMVAEDRTMVEPQRIEWTVKRGVAVLGIVTACSIGAARGETPVVRFEVTATAPVVLTVPDAAPTGKHFLRAGGEWLPVQGTPVADGALQVALPPSRGGLLLLNRPSWMSLEDTAPPAVISAALDGRPLQVADDGGVDAGCLPEGVHRLALILEDADNPIDVDSIRFDRRSVADGAASVQAEALEGAPRRVRATVMLDCRTPGTFEDTLAAADRSPARHVARVPVRHSIMGIAISEDRQQVRLSNGAQTYLLQPDLSRQLQLPNGVWAKLTTNMDGQWLYPREFTEVEITQSEGDVRTVRVQASDQSIKGKPVDGLARIEFVASVRTDTPALLITSRSINISDRPVPTYANWGWLPGAHYVIPDGQKEWRGKAADRYFDVGWPGWLWLAPSRAGVSGIGWMSPLKFGESRFDTMLLYSDRAMCDPGSGVEIGFAIALTESPDETQRIYDDLVGRGLLTAPEARTAPE
jgi:hypothetical protein